MILSETIKDSFDEIMEDFITGEEYVKKHEEINVMISDIRDTLPDSEKKKFIRLMDCLSEEKSALASEALVRGVVQGIELCNEYS